MVVVELATAFTTTHRHNHHHHRSRLLSKCTHCFPISHPFDQMQTLEIKPHGGIFLNHKEVDSCIIDERIIIHPCKVCVLKVCGFYYCANFIQSHVTTSVLYLLPQAPLQISFSSFFHPFLILHCCRNGST